VKRDHLKEDEVFYYADEFTISWLPTLHKMWSPVGQQIMIRTPWVKRKRFGLGAVNYHTGETVVKIEKRKRRKEIAAFLQMLVDKHPGQVVYVAWDNVNTHFKEEVEQVVEKAQDRLRLLFLPTYSPWLNPSEMLWRLFRKRVTHGEWFTSMDKVVEATKAFFRKCNRKPNMVLKTIGNYSA
jgi:putative transposase